MGTFLSIAFSFVLGIGLFVFLPHALTALIEKQAGQDWGLNSMAFHAVDGVIKAFIFISYIFLIGLIPDIRRVFQFHGAEHKSISTFEAGEDLTIKMPKSTRPFIHVVELLLFSFYCSSLFYYSHFFLILSLFRQSGTQL